MKFLAFLLLFATLVASCGGSKNCQIQPQNQIDYVKVREVIKDTSLTVKPDSSNATFQLVQDEKGKIKAIEEISEPGRKVEAPKVSIDAQNRLKVDCRVRAEELFHQWKEVYTDSVSKTVVHAEPIYRDKPVYIEQELTFWQDLQIWLGRILIVLLIIGVYMLYRTYWPKK